MTLRPTVPLPSEDWLLQGHGRSESEARCARRQVRDYGRVHQDGDRFEIRGVTLRTRFMIDDRNVKQLTRKYVLNLAGAR